MPQKTPYGFNTVRYSHDWLLSYTEKVTPKWGNCSIEKTISKKRPKDKMIHEYKYIQFGTKNRISSIIIDIDTKPSEGSIERICKEFKIPPPNFILETDRGIHLHWLLEYSVYPNKSKKQKKYYQSILDSILWAFGGDKNAVLRDRGGRKFRNPMKHKVYLIHTKELNLYHFNTVLYAFNDYKDSVSYATKPKKVTTKVSKPRLIVSVKDVVGAVVGTRNASLFEYLRKLAYRNHDNANLETLLLDQAMKLNSTFEEPLEISEIRATIKSILQFIATKYVPSTSNKETIEYNRKLAKNKAERVMERIKTAILSNPLVTLKHLLNLSNRKLGVYFGVSKDTAKKYRGSLKELLKSITDLCINTFGTDEIDTRESIFTADTELSIIIDIAFISNPPPIKPMET